MVPGGSSERATPLVLLSPRAAVDSASASVPLNGSTDSRIEVFAAWLIFASLRTVPRRAASLLTSPRWFLRAVLMAFRESSCSLTCAANAAFRPLICSLRRVRRAFLSADI